MYHSFDVTVSTTTLPLQDLGQDPGEHQVQSPEIEAEEDRGRHHDHGGGGDLLAAGPGDLLELGPHLREEGPELAELPGDEAQRTAGTSPVAPAPLGGLLDLVRLLDLLVLSDGHLKSTPTPSRDPAGHREPPVGRPGGTRTPNPRFWRPVLHQLSYWPSSFRGKRCAAFPPRTPFARFAGMNPAPLAARRPLFRFLVRGVLAAEAAVLAQLQTLGGLLLVLRGVVVPPLAVGALEDDVVAHRYLPSLPWLGDDLGDGAGAHRAAALPDGEAQPLLHRDGCDQLHAHLRVVPRHHHLHSVRQGRHPRHVRGPEVELRPVAREERGVTSPLLLRQHVHLTLELRVRGDAPRLGQHHPPLHFLPVRPPQQHPDVVPRRPLVQELLEHLDPRHHLLLDLRAQPHQLHFLPHLHLPPLHPPRRHRPPPRYRENVLHRHQERLVHLTRRQRDVLVHRLHQLQDRLRRPVLPRPLQRLQRRSPYHRDLVPRKLVLLQKLPDLQLHQVQKLRVVHHVHLVQEDHDVRNPHLTRQKDVLPGLRHRPVRRRHHQDRTVHLRRPRDHVLDVVRMSRAVHVRVVPVPRLVLHVRGVDRHPPLPLLRSVVDLVVSLELYLRVRRRQHLRDRRRQRRLPVVHVPDRPDVHVGLRPVELLLGHPVSSSFSRSPGRLPVRISLPGPPTDADARHELEPTTRIELVTSSLPRTRSAD